VPTRILPLAGNIVASMPQCILRQLNLFDHM